MCIARSAASLIDDGIPAPGLGADVCAVSLIPLVALTAVCKKPFQHTVSVVAADSVIGNAALGNALSINRSTR